MGHNWWVYKLIVNVSWSLTSFMAPVFIFGKYNLKPQLFEPPQTFNSPYNLKLVRRDTQPLSPSLTCPYFIWLCTMTTFILNCPSSSYYQQPVFICRQRVDRTILRSACIAFERACALWNACRSLVKTGTKQDVASAGKKGEEVKYRTLFLFQLDRIGSGRGRGDKPKRQQKVLGNAW